jgi:hypothetical protein
LTRADACRRCGGLALALVCLLGGPPTPPAHAQAPRLFGLADPLPPVDPSIPASFPPLNEAALVGLPADTLGGQRIAIDASSLAIDRERVVRYTLVVTGSGGARNVSYEAMRCDTRERQILALGRPDGSWAAVADPRWRPIERRDEASRHPVAVHERLCEGGAAAATTAPRLAARLRQASPGQGQP